MHQNAQSNWGTKHACTELKPMVLASLYIAPEPERRTIKK